MVVSRRVRDLIGALLLAVVYVLSATLGRQFTSVAGSVAPMGPPTGVALAALLLFGRRWWPGVTLGAYVVMSGTGAGWPAAAIVAVGNTFATLLAVGLIRRVEGFDPALRRLRDVVVLVAFGAGLSTLVSATVATVALALAGSAGAAGVKELWGLWWVGDALADVALAPALLVWLAPQSVNPGRRRRVELAALIATAVTFSVLAFQSPMGRPFLLFPIVVWAAVRFHQRGATAVSLLLAAIAGFFTVGELGPFATGNRMADLWSLDLFVSVLAVSGLILAALVQERDRVQSDLSAVNRELDERVRRQTEDLRLLLESSGEGIFGIDMEGRCTFINPAAAQMLGAEIADLVGQPVHALIHHSYPDGSPYPPEDCPILAALRGDSGSVETEVFWRADGSSFVAGYRVHPIAKDGEVLGAVVTFDDISQRKWSEDALRLLLDVTRGLAEAADLQSGFRVVLEKVCEATGWPVGTTWIPNAEGTALVLAHSHYQTRQSPQLLAFSNELLAFSPGEGLPGRAWMARHPVWMNDAERSNLPRDRFARELGMRSGMAIPIVSGDSVLAVVEFFQYEVRDIDERLLQLVSGVASQLAGLIERKRSAAALAHQALHDPLTGLPNRTLLDDRLQHALAQAARTGEPPGVLLVDLDGFKTVNDSLGHLAGDALLVAVAERLRGCVRSADTLARLGGDEFAILLERVSKEEAEAVCQRILTVLRSPFAVADRQLFVSASIGMVLSEPTRRNHVELLRDADAAMYAAKGRGKARYALFEPEMHSAAVEYLELAADLRVALDEGQLHLAYQPIVELSSERVVGAEALLRWTNPRLGSIPPVRFIPVAEETGLIVPIGRWVLRTACQQLREWDADAPGFPPLGISVNVSARQLQEPGFVDEVLEILDETGVDAPRLILEITESALMDESDLVVDRLRRLRSVGIRLAVDDFGTGYSSLSYLNRFPVDIVKIDKTFVDPMANGCAEDAALARTIIRLGQALNLDVVAEGIEEREQAAELIDLRCPLGQGYHYYRPVSGDDLLRIVERARTLQPSG